MFERPNSGERAILVHISWVGQPGADDLLEFEELALSAGAVPLDVVTGTRATPDPRLFVGSGKAQEIRSLIEATGAELVIFDHQLSPSQERNLEALLQCRVLDRSGLILDIFAQRARSFEGKLQVELAQLEHLSTRLVRGWTHLERQKGGIGLRGPGETQLETDRRLLGQRMVQIRKRLRKVESQREQGRRSRRRKDIPTVSLVGYTNAGKSTLFNRLTDAGVYVRDQLFATLDPTLRRVPLPDGSQVILADTVGFVSRLPHELVAAFRATLRETSEAQLLLHVVDASTPRRQEHKAEVEDVLHQIGALDLPRIEVFNKTDRLPDEVPRVERNASGQVIRVWLSAAENDGIGLLLDAITEHFHRDPVRGAVRLNPAQGRLRARLYHCGRVLRDFGRDDGGWDIDVELSRREFERLRVQDQEFHELWREIA